MSKKSYKQMQNRLYREIKRRIAAEQNCRIEKYAFKVQEKVETLKVACMHPITEPDIEPNILDEYIKKDLVRKLCNALYEGNYIAFFSCPSRFGCMETTALLKVVKVNDGRIY